MARSRSTQPTNHFTLRPVSKSIKENDWARWAGFVAVISMLAFASLVFLAVQNYPGYSFSANFLSDLGVHPASAALFNSACILAGLSVAFFAVAIHKSQRYSVKPVALLFLGIAGFFLAGVGLYTEHEQPMHFFATGGFFLFTAFSVMLTGVDWIKQKRTLGIFGLAGGVLLVGFVVISALSEQPLLQKFAVGATVLGFFGLGLGVLHDHWKN
ncbi:DUF998 domain-containing protein [Candidatus Micrarchaeota archaeon]|nr:DUF998 domain-containing protein [Candidatus Micrarchaeota archaeon]